MSSRIGDAALCAVVIAGTAVMLFGQAAWAAWPPSQPLDLVTAVGTLGSAVLALGLGLRDGIRRRQEAQERAHLSAAALLAPLQRLVTALHSSLEILNHESEAWQPLSSADTQRARNELQVGLANLEGVDLEPLIALPNRTANRVAKSLSLARTVLRELESHIGFVGPETFGLGKVLPAPKRAYAAVQLKAAFDSISPALYECTRAASFDSA